MVVARWRSGSSAISAGSSIFCPGDAGRGLADPRDGVAAGRAPHRVRPARASGARRASPAQRDHAELRHADPLAVAPACPAPVGGLVRERLRRPHRQPDHADPARGGRGGVPAVRRHRLRHRLHHRRGDPADGRGPAAGPAAARWLVLYGCSCAGRSAGRAPRPSASDARSAITGRVVDSYTNIHSVKMFAHHDREIDYAKEAIEHSRARPSSGDAHHHVDGCDPDHAERAPDRVGDVGSPSGSGARGATAASSRRPRRWSCGSTT
jgi:hypothetical protein